MPIFDLDITKPPAVVPLNDFVPGDYLQFTADVGLQAGDVVIQAQFVSKLRGFDADNAGTSYVVSIGALGSGGGIFTQNGALLHCKFTVKPTVSVNFTTKRVYAIRVWVQRGAARYWETVQVGTMIPNKYAKTTIGSVSMTLWILSLRSLMPSPWS